VADCIQVAYQRGLYDHIPLLLNVDDANWGPRPLQMLKCWSDYLGYEDFVREIWSYFDCHGWGGYVLKMKLKMMKTCLKEWYNQHFQNLDRMSEVKNKISLVDSKAEMSALMEDEVQELHDLSVNLHSLARTKNSVNWQKSRMNWLKEGDANSKFFHGVMSNHHRQNALCLLSVDGVGVEGVQNIRAAVYNHFYSHFKARGVDRPGVENLQFRKLTGAQAGNMTKPFSLAEVK